MCYKIVTGLKKFWYSQETIHGLGADHLIPGGWGGSCFFVKKSSFSKKRKINSLFSYLWAKNSLFMK